MSRATEALIELAETYWDDGMSIPMDLAADMMEAGLDVEALEEQALKGDCIA